MADRLPNLVLICADQWRGDCLSGIGSPHPVMTPHVTQLGCEGIRFSQAYADCPVCMPQRVTHLTGQVASRFGLPHNFGCRTPVDPVRGLPGRLAREAGYQTKAIGKMHFWPSRGRFGFEHISLHPNDYVNWLEEQGWGGFYRGHGLGGNEVYPAASALPERFTHTRWIVDEAVRFLGQRDPDCPFFLYVVFEAPHSPFDPPEPYERMYERITPPPPVKGRWLDEGGAPRMFRAKALARNYDHLTEEMVLESRRRYYGQVSHIDYQLGRFLGELKTLDLYEDTVICFTSDHGEHLGDHGIFGKATFLKGSADVPLVVRLPEWVERARPSMVIDAPVLTADIFPTFLELADLEPDNNCDGTSLLPVVQQRTGEPGRVVHGELAGRAFATDGEFKFLYYQTGGVEQLFDIASDSYDLVNRIDDEACGRAADRLRSSLVQHLERFDRPMVHGGSLVAAPVSADEDALRAQNPFAWRGPMRHGRGYYGYDG